MSYKSRKKYVVPKIEQNTGSSTTSSGVCEVCECGKVKVEGHPCNCTPTSKRKRVVLQLDSDDDLPHQVRACCHKGQTVEASRAKGQNIEVSHAKGKTVDGSGGKGKTVEGSGGKGKTVEASRAKGKTPQGSHGKGKTPEESGDKGKTAKESGSKMSVEARTSDTSVILHC
ncbi:hypothetical protein GUJ93_ZPchr0015g6896 [Zizania palustris]|uniref:Uncharacterized protein n=1 Tax=Zizania palustris TaxID=103762 RepID=A0A8J5TDE1_ZIZPA|nr:hypothetical protein GUJ93_ZPchr0015g6896 [Zizania palustris]